MPLGRISEEMLLNSEPGYILGLVFFSLLQAGVNRDTQDPPKTSGFL